MPRVSSSQEGEVLAMMTSRTARLAALGGLLLFGSGVCALAQAKDRLNLGIAERSGFVVDQSERLRYVYVPSALADLGTAPFARGFASGAALHLRTIPVHTGTQPLDVLDLRSPLARGFATHPPLANLVPPVRDSLPVLGGRAAGFARTSPLGTGLHIPVP